jgi:putative Mg2+ transporter-C (MgtC) family protein
MTRFQLLSWSMVMSHLVDLFMAYLFALPIGWSQEREGNSAGLRTFPIVAIASCGLILLAREILSSLDAQTRVLQGLITGIGFIGGGAILRSGQTTHGTATAASVLNVAVIGAATGYGLYDVAVVLSVVNLMTLRLLHPFKKSQAKVGNADE